MHYAKELWLVLQIRVVSIPNIFNISSRLNNTYLFNIWSGEYSSTTLQ
uniref:Uncharacterized protein n=1 Tax=Arundo donax TaxID=35708 RepID=A0A0A8ZPN3_ARUDO